MIPATRIRTQESRLNGAFSLLMRVLWLSQNPDQKEILWIPNKNWYNHVALVTNWPALLAFLYSRIFLTTEHMALFRRIAIPVLALCPLLHCFML
jgi:hypothetical protein